VGPARVGPTKNEDDSRKGEDTMTGLHNQVVRRRRSAERGFTLIELLVVISILSVLAAIVVINVTGVHTTANKAACASNAQTVQTALNQYYDDHNDAYPSGWTSGATITDVSVLAQYLSTTTLTGTNEACASFSLSTNGGSASIIVTGNPNP
jgi:prepilin-type N-terminal cleavage/methylation domain-containing protein